MRHVAAAPALVGGLVARLVARARVRDGHDDRLGGVVARVLPVELGAVAVREGRGPAADLKALAAAPVEARHLVADGRDVPASPGMGVQVAIAAVPCAQRPQQVVKLSATTLPQLRRLAGCPCTY